ncbi:MAG: transcriptional regulator, partial [Defluviicoccus sp.]|nr:transcriptional regulator [Defluviicoccus sp.]
RALERGLNVMLFSDNVAVEEEVALKALARERGLLMMGPDCGTAMIAGAPIGFANAVPRGDIGLIAASGTGLQEVACLIARAGGGISHGIGVGGRDLGAAVGGAMTLAAIEALDRDDATERIVLISKPPDPGTAGRIADRISASRKRFTLCCIGMEPVDLPENARQAATLREAAEDALEGAGGAEPGTTLDEASRKFDRGTGWVRGLFSGGSLCAEAQAVLMAAGIAFVSNVPIPGAEDAGSGHRLIDLGADEFTRGRPHPMIEPAVRDAPLKEALADPDVGVVLVDVVLGHGSHEDPAGRLAAALAAHDREAPVVIASVCGTDRDPQNRAAQVETLREAGVVVAASNAGAAETAAALLSG